MPDDQITFRTDPAVKTAIAALVADGEWRTVSEYVNHAILLWFHMKSITLNGRAVGPWPLERVVDSPRGRENVRRILFDEREPRWVLPPQNGGNGAGVGVERRRDGGRERGEDGR